VDLAVVATVFILIVPAELPDKTFVATLVLATRFRPALVFIGSGLGLVVQAAIAVIAGSAVALLPSTLVHAVSAAIFAIGAVVLYRGTQDPAGEEREVTEEISDVPAEPSPYRVMLTSFVVLFLAEWGDLTQLLTASLSAKYHDALSVFVGSALGLVTVAAAAVTGGKALVRFIPLVWIRRVAAAAFAVVAVITALEAAGVL
jgi:Ca2+/H+ antiporter, TMEM165/GDT1 family